ncbi:hypothetical protein KCP74_03295 [Salmonella enterica subsp. enterica]|nr:hypothetical protein KCP74_03295 [Salmonella enterica subsp. enterica]
MQERPYNVIDVNNVRLAVANSHHWIHRCVKRQDIFHRKDFAPHGLTKRRFAGKPLSRYCAGRHHRLLAGCEDTLPVCY